MRSFLQSLRLCARGLGTLCLWCFWLLLCLLAAAQLHLATTREFALPGWALRKLEAQIAAKGLRASIGAARFDPTGHLALYDLKFSPASFKEPLLTAGEIHLKADPVSLFALHRIDLQAAHASNLTLYLPAQLSPSGRNEPVFDRTNLAFSLDGKTLVLSHLSTKSGPLHLSVTGTWPLPSTQNPNQDFPTFLDHFLTQYLKLSRTLSRALTYLEPFENPRLRLAVLPDRRLDLSVDADRLNLPGGLTLPNKALSLPAFTTGPLQLHTTVPLDFSGPIPLDLNFQLASVDLPRFAQANQILLNLRGQFDPATGQLQPSLALLTARDARALSPSIPLNPVILKLTPAPLPQLNIELLARYAQTPLALQANVDLRQGAADVSLQTQITPPLLAALSPHLKRDLTLLLQPNQPAPLDATLRLERGFQLHSARARFSSGPVTASQVYLDYASADIFYDGKTLFASDLTLFTGDSRAAGSYWMNTQNLDYRFLLAGQLQPAAINGWFTTWWPDFWKNFRFSELPSANIDIRGRWRSPRNITVFISVDAPQPVVRTVAFDRVHTSLFIRPQYSEALRLLAVRPEGQAQGTFARTYDIDAHGMREMRFDFRSTLDLASSGSLFGSEGTALLAPYQLAQSPNIELRGSVQGPAHPDGAHQSIDLAITSRGPLAYYQFPLTDFNAAVSIRDRAVSLENIQSTYADGKVTGRAAVSGPTDNRQLTFDIALAQARFGQANRTLQTFLALRRKKPAPAVLTDFDTRTANSRLDLQLAASGPIDNPLAFTGKGKFALDGDLAQINLFGALSRVLSNVPLIGASSLQLNRANSSLQLNQAQLDLPDLRLTGRSAAIDLKGNYRFDTESIDLNAKVYPFESSSNVFSQTFDLVLTPFTHVLELKLTGTLANPNWNFLYSPFQLFVSPTSAPPSNPPSPAPTPN